MKKNQLCLNCLKGKSILHPRLGYLPCRSCQNKTTIKPQRQEELPGESIKQQRKEYRDDMLQPWREGQLSKEYIEKHGTENIKVTPEEVKNAKNVWTGDLGDYYTD